MLWITIVGMGAFTFLIRFSFIGLSSRLELPDPVQRALEYVPVAVLSAIVVPALLQPEGNLMLNVDNKHLWAGLLAIAVAWRWQNVISTVTAGMCCFWLLTFLGL